MTRRYDDGAFISEEPKRRPIRDRYRNKFFAELGGERLKDPFAFDPDPAEQLKTLKTLFDIASGIHMDDKSALNRMTVEVLGLGLGVPVVGATPIGRPDIDSITVGALERTMFDRWFGSAAYGR